MKSTLDCIPCFVEHTLHVAKMTTDNPDRQFEIIKKVLREIAGMELEQTPPEMARKIHGIIRDTTGVADAYTEVKDNSTETALKLLPRLKEEIEKTLPEERFEKIVRFIIGGNIIDFGADINFNLKNAHERILEVTRMSIDHYSLKQLKTAMDKAENILYIADNCGEAVFDSLLIEPYRTKTVLAVRGFPILNDITPREIFHSGLEGLPSKIINTGDATPGVVLKYCSEEFKEAFRNADIIISKGQGNFETLSDTDRPIFFLLRVKCKVVSRILDDAEHGSLHIIPKNIPEELKI